MLRHNLRSLVAILCTVVALPAAEPDPDAAIYQKIERLRQAAANLRLDGNDRDWAEFPQFADPRNDAGADSRRDILAVALAPTETDLWVMIRTAGPPAGDPWSFYVRRGPLRRPADGFPHRIPIARGGPLAARR